jgi:hypothetical protein
MTSKSRWVWEINHNNREEVMLYDFLNSLSASKKQSILSALRAFYLPLAQRKQGEPSPQEVTESAVEAIALLHSQADLIHRLVLENGERRERSIELSERGRQLEIPKPSTIKQPQKVESKGSITHLSDFTDDDDEGDDDDEPPVISLFSLSGKDGTMSFQQSR